MRVILLFSVDPDMPDPERGHPEGVHAYEAIGNDEDVFVLWRQRGPEFEGGYRDHIFAQGVFENVSRKIVKRVRRILGGL